MKRKTKVMAVLLATVVCLLLCVPAGADYVESKLPSAGFGTEEEVFSALNGSNADAASVYASENSENYAGMYIDDDGTLVLMYVGDENALAAQFGSADGTTGELQSADGKRSQKTRVVFARYSYAKLEEINELLIDKIDIDSGVRDMSVDVKNNRIEIGISSSADENELSEYLYSLLPDDVEKDIIFVKQVEDDDEVRLCASVTQTSSVRNGSFTYASVGVGCKRSGASGFLTAGHAFSVNDVIYYNGSRIGAVTAQAYNGKCDAAFVKFDSGNSYKSTATSNEELVSEVPVVGTTVTQRGSSTGVVTGKVTSKSYSYIGNGHWWTGLIKTDRVMADGDSGGGLKCGVMDSGRTGKIVGILHGCKTDASLYIKTSEICDKLGVTG